MLTPLIMKLEHFLPLPDQDKGWLNSLVLSYDDFPRGIRDQREHAKIIEVSINVIATRNPANIVLPNLLIIIVVSPID